MMDNMLIQNAEWECYSTKEIVSRCEWWNEGTEPYDGYETETKITRMSSRDRIWNRWRKKQTVHKMNRHRNWIDLVGISAKTIEQRCMPHDWIRIKTVSSSQCTLKIEKRASRVCSRRKLGTVLGKRPCTFWAAARSTADTFLVRMCFSVVNPYCKIIECTFSSCLTQKKYFRTAILNEYSTSCSGLEALFSIVTVHNDRRWLNLSCLIRFHVPRSINPLIHCVNEHE